MIDVIRINVRMRSVLCAIMVAIALAVSSSHAAAAGKCPGGEVSTPTGGCMPAGASSCGNGRYCVSGTYCSTSPGNCIFNGDVDCHNGTSCHAGFICVPGGCRDPNAPVRNNSNSSGCGSDVTGIGGPARQRTNCGGGSPQVTQQRAVRHDLRTILKNRMYGGQPETTTYTYDYDYTEPSAPLYREAQQVVYEKVKKQCGDIPTTECASQVVSPVSLRKQLKDKLQAAMLKQEMAKVNGAVESEVPPGSSSGSRLPGGAPPVAASSSAVPEQSLFCHMIMERIQDGDMQYSRDEQIPPDCRRDQEIIDALKKAKADHPYVGVAGPDTDHEIAHLLRPLGSHDDAIKSQLPLEPPK